MNEAEANAILEGAGIYETGLPTRRVSDPVTVQQIIAAGWPAAESCDAAERPERARAILALFEPQAEENAALKARVRELETVGSLVERRLREDVSEARAQLAAAGRVIADLAKHECPLGPRVVWCPRHDVYHPTAFDEVLSLFTPDKAPR